MCRLINFCHGNFFFVKLTYLTVKNKFHPISNVCTAFASRVALRKIRYSSLGSIRYYVIQYPRLPFIVSNPSPSHSTQTKGFAQSIVIPLPPYPSLPLTIPSPERPSPALLPSFHPPIPYAFLPSSVPPLSYPFLPAPPFSPSTDAIIERPLFDCLLPLQV